MTTTVVVFPDAVADLVGAIRAELADRSVPAVVSDRVPAPRPALLVRLLRTGGPRATIVTDRPQITVEAWAPTPQQAHDLVQLVRGIIFSLRGTVQNGHSIYRVEEFGGPANLPDPLSASPRYVFTVQVHIRGDAA